MTMKVRIEDKEALQALSWKALRAYLDRAKDWQYAEDIPNKAAVYQHTGKGQRLLEVVVPLRNDFADYAARMGDAVGTLARVEDRSELDVYQDLRALGAQLESGTQEDAETSPPAIDEATRAVHKRIRKWLAEEGWHVRDVDDPQSSFNVMATLQSGPNVNIFQYTHHVDRITFSQHWLFDAEFRSEISQLPEHVVRDVVWNIYRDVSMMGVEFSGLDTPTTELTLRAYLYFDGLTKDTFVQRALLTIRSVVLAIRTFVRALEEHHHSSEAATRLLRFVPQTAGPLTVAG
jgi:hypothetical protein